MRNKDARLKCAACLFRVGLGVKLVQRFTGCPETTVKRLRREIGTPARQRPSIAFGLRPVGDREWMEAAWAAEWPRSQQYIAELGHWAFAYPLPSPAMRGYYRDIERARGRGRLAARERYLNEEIKTKIARALRTKIWNALKHGKAVAVVEQLVGCSLSNFRAHLESRFTSGMDWGNYGEWEIDHRIPCAAFDLADGNDRRKCFHYSNLQPLWRTDNRRKWLRVA